MYQLLKLFIQSRSLNGFTTLLRQKIELLIRKRQCEVEGKTAGPPISENKGRCDACISNLAGLGHKLKKNQMYRVKTLCRTCKKIILLQHLKHVKKIRKNKN